MKVTTYGLVDSERKAYCEAQAPTVSIFVSEFEVDARGGFGMSLASIDVQREDGKTARFWVSARRTNLGRITLELRANHAEHETSKRVTGSWLDYVARARVDSE